MFGICICVHVHSYLCGHVFTCICMFVCLFMYLHIYLYVCVCLSFSPYLKKAYSMNSEEHQNIIAIVMIPFSLFF